MARSLPVAAGHLEDQVDIPHAYDVAGPQQSLADRPAVGAA
jgi:hypothetical protein